MEKIEIIHIPSGIDDPYITLPGVERDPRDPLSGDMVKINFLATPLLGQRAWIEYTVDGENIQETRAQFQNNVNGKALWYGFIPPVDCGKIVQYKIKVGTGKEHSVVTDWYSYTVKQWQEDKEKITFKGNGSRERIEKVEHLTDGKDTYSIRIRIRKEEGERFFGLGEHYEGMEIGNGTRYVHVFDQYKVQRERAYAPIPFIFSNNCFGMFVNTGFRTKWEFSTEYIEVEIETLGIPVKNEIEVYLWQEENMKKMISNIYAFSQPKVPPMWAFGPWMSANQWNSQKKVERALQNATHYDLPATVLVIEAWSDEQAFYIFNGAQYSVKEDGEPFHLSDFRFNEPWPDPKGMIQRLNEKNIRLVLWQIPVLKYYEKFENQHEKDVEYALKNDYVVKKTDGTPYKIPEGRWFEKSYVVDFFNPKAAKWWSAKRKYLVEELGVAGFKTDGGEHLWGRDIASRVPEIEGSQLRNIYPEKYFETAKSIGDGKNILFSRSGYTHSPSNTLFWVGDEDSEYEAFKSNIVAGLNTSLSGNPFWGWDIAGFSGDLPNVDLYERSCELAIFTPIFQFHSEHPGDPVPNAERSPWNIAEYYNAPEVIDHYRFYASLRMNISPYILQQAKIAVENGTPLTYPVWLEYSQLYDEKDQTCSYFFGENILVYPRFTKEDDEKLVKLPEGEWLDLWTGEWIQSNGQSTKDTCLRYHPVYLRKGALIPLSIEKSKQLGESHWSQDFNATLIVDDLNDYENIDMAIAKYQGKIQMLKSELCDATKVEDMLIGFPKGSKKGIIDINWIDLR